MKRDIFIGGAWPYANYLLHIGHLAALLPGDVIARYYRGCGDNVIYVSGTDSHGTPITVRAKKEGKTAKEIAEFYHNEFVKSFNRLGFTYDLYTSTMTEYHGNLVKKYFKSLCDNGYIYEKVEKQDFCPNCNSFLSDREITGICPHCGGSCSGDQCDSCLASLNSTEVLNKKCKECMNDTVLMDNKHLYFRLSSFQKELEHFVNSRTNTWRKHAITESRTFLDMGLIDRAVSRQLDWGIEIPVEGYDDKRIYVWIEAVLGYLTAGSYVAKQRGIDFDKYMSNDNKNLLTYFVHGKDNIPFHTIIFPALIMGLKNNYQLPKYIISSEYVNMNDEKMSKSKGNLITVNDLLDTYDLDTIRYYMIANGPEKNDINFTNDDLVQAHNKFLVGVLGNFVNRNLSFVNKKFNGVISCGIVDADVLLKTRNLYNEIGKLIEAGELKLAMELITDYIRYGNKYYDEKEPWVLVKNDVKSFNEVTYTCIYMIANISNFIAPFMPETSEKIKNMLSLPDFAWKETVLKGNIKINQLNLLFNRIEL